METHAQELTRLEVALLNEASVYDCAVRRRDGSGGATRVVAYLVTGNGFDEPSVREHLRRQSLPELSAIVQLSALPIANDGHVDEAELASIPIIDAELLQRYQEQLLANSAVADVAVVAEEYVPENLPLHISDLLPEGTGVVASVTRTVTPQVTAASSVQKQTTKQAISHGGPLRNPDIPKLMSDALKRAAAMPETHGVTYIQSDGSAVYQSYSAMLQDAERILAGLRKLGVKTGDSVVFQLERNQDFIPAFWACMLGGFLAAPISIAPTYKEENAVVSKLHNCWDLLGRPLIVAGEKLVPELKSVAAMIGVRELPVCGIDALRANDRDRNWHAGDPEDVCLILFTSGSTGVPKGVQQCHRSLLSRSAATAERNNFDHNEVSLNWFPLDHVGGIVMFHLNDLFSCAQQVQVQTEVILQDPLKWLDLIEKYRATITWAPNFAFGLVNDHEAEITTRKWDLSSMRFILNGGEAIVAKTARRFLQILGQHGLRDDAMHPSWGMSETCSGVVFSERCHCDIIRDEDSFVEVGGPIAGVSLRVVDADDHVIGENQIGRLQISGTTVTSGYYKNPELNRESFSPDGWFNTGDLATLNEGRLTITGRAKDVIIINGVNFYSHELEAIVEDVEGVDVSFTAACAVRIGGIDTDRLAIFFSTPATDWPGKLDVIGRIREVLLRTAGVHADYIIPVPQSEIPKTAIGKIQRTKMRERFEASEFAELLKQIDIRSASANTVPNWFYRREWRRRESGGSTAPISGTYLVFSDQRGLTDGLSSQASADRPTWIRIREGKQFNRISAVEYEIRASSAEDYKQVAKSAISDHSAISGVVHAWSYDKSRGEFGGVAELRDTQFRGAYSLLFLIRALAETPASRDRLKLFVVTNRAQKVNEGESGCPEKASISGLLATCALEMGSVQCCHVDLEGESVADDLQHLTRELSETKTQAEVGYRIGYRHIPTLSRVDMSAAVRGALPLKRGGCYLITGGLGGLGTMVAEYLLKSFDARLLLIGRTDLSSAGSGNGEIRDRRAENLQHLESCGAGHVLYHAADIANLSDLDRAIASAEEQWGHKLDGVFHLAGSLAGSGDLKAHWDNVDQHWLASESLDRFESAFHSKVYGTWAVMKVLERRPEALLVAFSSVNALFGGSGFGAYSAANSALDAFAAESSRAGRKTYCFNWSMWDDIGMSEDSPAYGRETARSMGYQLIGKQQGMNSMLAAMCGATSQVIVGLEGHNSAMRRHLRDEVYPRFRPVAYYVPATMDSNIREASGIDSLQFTRLSVLPRTQSGEFDQSRLAVGNIRAASKMSAVIEPRTEMEKQVARIWKEVLGVSQLSVDDTFFELGGDSLTAMRLINRLRVALQTDISVRMLFELPSVEKLSAALAETSTREAVGRVAAAAAPAGDLLTNLDSMSEDEIDRLLDEMKRDELRK